jgi:DNA repair and recombination RAD54-like protein
MGVLSRMLQTLRLGPERIVIVSNYTQTLDVIQALCTQCNYPVLRLDGSISANKRTSVVDAFNNPSSGAFVFLLSSKAGGCGINLIGGSR